MRLQVLVVLGLLGLMVIGGCSAPKGKPPRATGGQADPETLIEFAGQVSEALPAQVADRFSHLEQPGVIEMGDIVNRTYTDTNDFRVVRQRIRNAMINSDILRQYFIVVEDIDRMQRELERLSPDEPEGLLDDDALAPEGTTRLAYDPEHVYVFNGEMGEITRSGGSYYLFEFTLTHLATRQIMFSNTIESRQSH